MDQARVHLSFIFDESDVPEIAAARWRWDPVMASQVPPHVTLVYPEEYTDEELLIDRAQDAAKGCSRFSLRCDQLTVGDDGNDAGTCGVFISVADPTGSWDALRRLLLREPFRPTTVRPHLTVVHPRTSALGPDAWHELEGSSFALHLAPIEFALTSTDPEKGMRVRQRFALGQATRQLCAAVIPVRNRAALLGKRSAVKEWYPGVWDLIGGRVEAHESVIMAACREAYEELDVHLSPADLVYITTLTSDDYELAVFASHTWERQARNAAPLEHDEVRWFRPDELPLANLAHPSLSNVVAAACSLPI